MKITKSTASSGFQSHHHLLYSFAGLVFKMLLAEVMISEELVENMNSWKHSGFRDLPGTTCFWLCWFPG
ncbi:MAG: hypothetical protein K8R76_08095, partial [Candidatus Aegiribacteria sp.]|nr:hypothetical protein [Candidatus Aegiribacteria sp.]